MRIAASFILVLITLSGFSQKKTAYVSGKVIDENETRGQTREIRKLNELIKNDQRVF